MIALVAAAVMFVGAVLGWVLTRPDPTTTIEKPTVNVLQMPRAPLTRAQQRRAKRSAAARSPDSTPSPKSAAPSAARRSPNPPVRRQTRPRRRAPTRKPTRRRPAPTSTAQRPPGQTTPARPPADVQVPAPVTVCIKPLGGVNCN